MQFFETLLLFAEPAMLALLLVYAFGMISRSSQLSDWADPLMGLLFGVCAIAAMLNPIALGGDVIVDVRSLFVALSAAYFGVIGGAVTFLMAAVTRFVIGGDAAALGVLGITLAGLLGIFWTMHIRPRLMRRQVAYLSFGAVISLHMLIGLVLPAPVRHVFFSELVPILVIVNVIGGYVVASLIEKEHAHAKERDSLVDAAGSDPLTKLLNRASARAKYDMLPKVQNATGGTAMMCIDVDHFKQINDTYGHLRGDEVLIQITQRIRACLRTSDIFARMSGDEFLIVLNDLTAENAQEVTARCQKSVANIPVVAEGAEIQVSISVGCSWVAKRPSFRDFRFAADQALYRAKENGRNCLIFDLIEGAFPHGPKPKTIVA